MKMLNTKKHGCFEEIQSDTKISSLAPGFAGERAGVRGPSFQAIRPLTPQPPLPEDGARGRKIFVSSLCDAREHFHQARAGAWERACLACRACRACALERASSRWYSAKVVCFLLLAVAVTKGRLVLADSILLRNGTIVEGLCMNAADKNATEWQIETSDGLQFTISRSDVKEIRPNTADQKKYAEAIASKDDSLEVHRRFVEACSKLGLDTLADAHRERIVELDPTDKSAWAALDYLETSEGWIRKDLFQKRRGLQKKGTRYFIPQDLAIQQSNVQATQMEAAISKKVDKAIKDIRTNTVRTPEALQFLNSLRDPFAVPKLREVLKSERSNSNAQLRHQLIEIISKIHSTAAVKALIDSALFDPDQSVRGESIAKLSEFGRELAVEALTMLLRNGNPAKDKPETYDRVGEALATLGDERCIPRLIDCLVTEHIRAVPAQPAINAGAQSNGNMQFSQGQPKPEKVSINNNGVLTALQSVTQGENFGFDVKAWQNWYAKTYAASNRNVLRDP